MKMTVFWVYIDIPYEGQHEHSLFLYEETAKAHLDRLKAGDSYGARVGMYVMEPKEIDCSLPAGAP